MVNHLALVSDTMALQVREVMEVASALNKQLVRDFSPVWNVPATLDAFQSLEDVPTGYWPIVVKDDINVPGAAGIHLDDDGKPFGLVNRSDNWMLTASHEALEMLADPLGNTLRAGPSIQPGQGRVEYLVEVCDPSEAWEFGYDVNGVRVSDFYTPEFFRPIASQNVRYSFTEAISAPRQVLKGGYLSWLDPASGHWWQQRWFGTAAPVFVDLGPLTGTGSAREQLDRLSAPDRFASAPLAPKNAQKASQEALVASHQATAQSKASRLRKQIDELCAQARASAGR